MFNPLAYSLQKAENNNCIFILDILNSFNFQNEKQRQAYISIKNYPTDSRLSCGTCNVQISTQSSHMHIFIYAHLMQIYNHKYRAGNYRALIQLHYNANLHERVELCFYELFFITGNSLYLYFLFKSLVVIEIKPKMIQTQNKLQTSLEHNVFKSLNVSMGTLCGLNFATESDSDRKNHIDSLIFACMSLSI